MIIGDKTETVMEKSYHVTANNTLAICVESTVRVMSRIKV